MCSHWRFSLLFLALFVWSARADGPHWQVPNPDGAEEETSVDNEKGGAPAAAAPAAAAAAPAAPVGPNGPFATGNADYMKNPGDFMKMDFACIDYYQRHAVILFENKIKTAKPVYTVYKATTEKDFYLLIINRCAQAMREVDNYLPCPDSFPLWHTDELRELMIDYAARTWQRSTQLRPEYAKACAELAVQCYVDTVRFRDPTKDASSATLKELILTNTKMRECLEKMDAETDANKKKALWDQCQGLLRASSAGGSMAKALVTFRMITGDIPLQVDDAEARMMLALVNMGSIVMPALQNATKNANPAVQKAAWTVLDMIQRRFQKPEMLGATMSNVIQVLRDQQAKPNTAEAQNAVKILKNMGSAALPFLVRVAENETMDLKALAFEGMKVVTGKSFGSDLAKWKAYAKEMEGK